MLFCRFMELPKYSIICFISYNVGTFMMIFNDVAKMCANPDKPHSVGIKMKERCS